MSWAEDNERPIDPTPQQRQRARAEGRVARSSELVSAFVLFGALLSLRYLGGPMIERIESLAQRHWSGAAWVRGDTSQALDVLRGTISEVGLVLLPLLVVLLALAILASVGQTGFLWTPARVSLQWERLGSLTAASRMLRPESWLKSVWGLTQLALVVVAAGASLWARRLDLLEMSSQSTTTAAASLGRFILDTGIATTGALLLLGIIDFGVQWWRHEQSLRMTTDQFREELRQTEGAASHRVRRRVRNSRQ